MKKTITLYDGARRIHLFKVGTADFVGARHFEGIELLGRGEFVIPPATIGDKKTACRFVAGRGPGEVRLAAAPEWLSPAFRTPTTEPLPAKAMEVRRIRIEDILVDEADRRKLDEADVLSMAQSIAENGMMTPITVRQDDGGIHLVAGWLRFNATKKLGWESIDAAFFEGDKIDARIWQGIENLDRLDLPALQRFEELAKVIDLQASRISRQNVGKKRGRPENLATKAARELSFGGKTEEARVKAAERAKKVAALPAEVKAEVKARGLDDKASALLEIAKEKTPDGQLAKLHEIANHKPTTQPEAEKKKGKAKTQKAASKSSASGKPVDTTIPPAAGSPATVPETVSRDETAAEIERLKAELAEKTEKLRQTENELRQARLAASRASERAVTSPSSVPTHGDDDLDIPAYLDRRPLSADEEKAFAALDAAWSNAPAIVQERFIAWMLPVVADAHGRSVNTRI
jgi:ParB/RepB/Spo0J family partition protein